MKVMGFEEHDDPSLSYIFGKGAFPDIPSDPRDTMGDLYEETEAHKRDLKINKANMISKPLLRQILTKKNFYPNPKPPNLLTWAEKQTIRNLHDAEPGEWTAKKLSECFPAATETIIKDVIKNRSPSKMNCVQAKKHDDIVLNNWRLLTQGKIKDQLGEELYNQLINVGPKLIKEGNFSSLSSANIRQLQETMLNAQTNDSEETFCIAPRSSKGPFGSIIADYTKKVESKLSVSSSEKNHDISSVAIEGKDLLIDGDLPHDRGQKYARDARRGTALMNVDINLSAEQHMTMDTFKKLFKENLSAINSDSDISSNDSTKFLQSSPVHSMSKEFLKWLHAEQEKNHSGSHCIDNHVSKQVLKSISQSTRKKSKLKKPETSFKNSDITSQDFSSSKWITKLNSDLIQK